MKRYSLLVMIFLSMIIVSAGPYSSNINQDFSTDINVFQGNLTNLSEMQDTNIPAPTDDQVLTWSSATAKWIAKTTATFNKWIIDSSGGFLYTTSDTLFFNNTLLNLTIDDRAVTTEVDPIFTSENTTISRIGDCPTGQLVQNVTTGGVECSSAGTGDITSVQGDDIYIYNGSNSGDVVLVLNETKLNETIEALDTDTTYTAGSNLTLIGTVFSLDTSGVILWLNDIFQPIGNYLTSADEPNLNVNSSNFWDSLDDPSDIDGSDINNDRNWINFSQVNNGTFLTEEVDPLWTANQSSYSTTADIFAFGYYNASDFVITDYFTKTEIVDFGHYNSSDFVISDYFTASQVLAFNYYNSSDFNITDYFTSAEILGFNYYNSSDFVITDYYTKTEIEGFNYYNITDFDIANYVPYVGANSNLVLGDNNFSVGGSDFFVDEGTGYIGIGTTSPSELLELAKTGSNSEGPMLSLRNTATAISVTTDFILGEIKFAGNDKAPEDDGVGAKIVGYASGPWQGSINDYPAFLGFYTNPDGADAIAERMRITSEGSVGIGTVTPQSLLNIGGTPGTLASGLTFGDGDTGFYESVDDRLQVVVGGAGRWEFHGDVFRALDNVGPELGRSSSSTTIASIRPQAGDNDVGLNTAAADQLSLIAGGVEQMRLSQNDAADDVVSITGNVGIGTTSPAEKLQVAGNIFLQNDTDKLYFGQAMDVSIEMNGSAFNILDEIGSIPFYLSGFSKYNLDSDVDIGNNLNVTNNLTIGGSLKYFNNGTEVIIEY